MMSLGEQRGELDEREERETEEEAVIFISSSSTNFLSIKSAYPSFESSLSSSVANSSETEKDD